MSDHNENSSCLDSRSIDELASDLKGPIVVFGAGGFIGANLVHHLLRTRSDVFAVTHQHFIPWRLADIPQRSVIACNINDKEAVQELFNTYKFRTVLFFAAYGAYAKQSDPNLIYQTNVCGLINATLAAEASGVDAFIHAGSQSEYGLNCSGSNEDFTLEPNSHYAVSKVSAAYLIKYLGEQKRFPIINLRLYSAYGPWEEPDRLIPTVIQAGQRGNYPPFVNPNISRDFVYVEDIVRATFLAAIHGVISSRGRSVNIASGTKTTIKDVAHEARALFSISGEPKWGEMPNRDWDLKEWFGDPSLAEQVLKWRSTTPFHVGLKLTKDWFENNSQIPKIYQPIQVTNPLRISAIIACYKDGQAIPIMYQRLTDTFRSMQVEYEIIFVNDASPDESQSVLNQIAANDNRVVVVEHSRNFGSQSAFISGMHASSGDAVVLMDGDLQDPPEIIPSFFDKWHRDGFEVVYGRRVKREASWAMAHAYKAFYRIFRQLAEINIPVDAGDFSLIDRKVVNELLKLPETDQFLRGLRAWVGFKQTGVDYIRPERLFGVSTNNLRKNLKWARKGIFSFSFAPLEYLLFGGLALMLLAFVAMIITIAMKFIDSSIPRGFTMVVALLLGFGGLQLFSTAIIGEYIGKILEETKKRPKYIVRSIMAGGLKRSTTPEINDFLDARGTRLGN